MKEYTIIRIKDQIDWSRVPELHADTVLWEPYSGIQAFGQFCYNDENLYVHLRAVEEHIRAQYTAPLSPVHKDSCLEFFFMPEDRYFNFEINPNGCLHIGFGHNRQDRTVLFKKDDAVFFDIRTDSTDDGWEVYYRIPLSFIRLFYPDYHFEGTMRANVYKCGDETAHIHYLSWNPVSSETPDFHRPQDFGRMTFGDLKTLQN